LPALLTTAAGGDVYAPKSQVSFVPLDITKESALQEVLAHIDHAIQYGEDLEVKANHDLGEDEEHEPDGREHEWDGRDGGGDDSCSGL